MAQTILEPTSTTQPFHNSVVEEINGAKTLTHLTIIGNLLLKTNIPKDHGTILIAWNAKCQELHYGINFAARVAKSIEVQEREAARGSEVPEERRRSKRIDPFD